MEARVKGGLLDKILRTPAGGVLYITPEEHTGIYRAVTEHVLPCSLELMNQMAAGEFKFLGRTMRVRYPLLNERTTPHQR